MPLLGTTWGTPKVQFNPRTRQHPVKSTVVREDSCPARATAMAIGPVAFFMKPFDDEKFITAVRDALHSSLSFLILPSYF